MRKIAVLLAASGALFFSCVMPEKFTCNITVDKQGAYTVDFRGTLVYIPALGEIGEQGSVSAETDNDIKEYLDETVSKDSLVKKYEYRNSGRIYIEYLNNVTDGSTVDLSSSLGMPLTIASPDDDTIVITGKAAGSSAMEAFAEYVSFGYKLDGLVQITSDLPVADAGGLRVGRKFLLFGPYVVKKEYKTFPAEDTVIIIRKR
jgi:hypothetical protein